jgi:hypothetical protein
MGKRGIFVAEFDVLRKNLLVTLKIKISRLVTLVGLAH